jgi:hypothetical protein
MNLTLIFYILVAACTLLFPVFEYWLNRSDGHNHTASLTSALLLLGILASTSVAGFVPFMIDTVR